MITSPEQLKAMTESQIVKPVDPEGDKFVQKNLSERIREKWHNIFYGNKTQVLHSHEKGANI